MKTRFYSKYLIKCLKKNKDPLETDMLALLSLRSRSTMKTKCTVVLCVTKSAPWCHVAQNLNMRMREN